MKKIHHVRVVFLGKCHFLFTLYFSINIFLIYLEKYNKSNITFFYYFFDNQFLNLFFCLVIFSILNLCFFLSIDTAFSIFKVSILNLCIFCQSTVFNIFKFFILSLCNFCQSENFNFYPN